MRGLRIDEKEEGEEDGSVGATTHRLPVGLGECWALFRCVCMRMRAVVVRFDALMGLSHVGTQDTRFSGWVTCPCLVGHVAL